MTESPPSYLKAGHYNYPTLISAIFIALLTLFSIYLQSPPATSFVNRAASEFSADRAMRHLEVIADAPRPRGSRKHAETRDYLLNELTRMGLKPETQSSDVGIRNILARLMGTGGGKAILLAGHYDTVTLSPGAGDDGSAVVVILDTMRALLAGPPLRNDVIALFTDGEETGLVGANEFARNHPYAANVGLVLNFEARGTRGPVLMFETSPNNGWLIKQYANSSHFQFANSFMPVIYKLLPHDTDFTMFKEAGFAGLNFAFIDGYTNYHTAADNLQNLDMRTLQHQGDNALALTRRFGDADLGAAKSNGDEVYFDFVGLFLIHYPARWAVPLMMATALIFLAVITIGIKRKRLAPSGILVGLLIVVPCMISSALCAGLTWIIVSSLLGPGPSDTALRLFHIGIPSLAAFVSSALFLWLSKNTSVENATAGALLWWLLLMVIMALLQPAASYVFMWPLLSSTLGLAFLLRIKADQFRSWKSMAALSICVLPGIFLFAPVFYLMFLGATLKFSGAVMVCIPLLLGLMTAQLKLLIAANDRSIRASGW